MKRAQVLRYAVGELDAALEHLIGALEVEAYCVGMSSIRA